MAKPAQNDKQTRYQETSESFSGRLLTDPQFKEAVAITGILEREIRRSGSFKDKLSDYAHAFARSERFDAMRAETTIRDLFKERFGQTMNGLREELMQREESLSEGEMARGHDMALSVGDMVETGNKLTFNRALAHQSEAFATELGVTHAKARSLMSEQFEAQEGGSFYEWGKALDQDNYRAQIDAEKEDRAQSQERRSGRSALRKTASRSMRARSGPVGP